MVSIQSRIFEIIRDKKKSADVVNQLIDLLAISRASVYKRIKGEIQLTVGELEQIIEHFDVDMAQVFQRKSNQVIMELPTKADGTDPILHYLKPIKAQMLTLTQMPASHILFLAVSFPIFYSFLYPELALFKFIVYRNSVWKSSLAKVPPIAIAQLARNQEYIDLFAAIRNAYARIDSTEVWTSNFYQSTINELKFYLECNLFQEPEEALLIMDKMALSIENIANMAQEGHKHIMGRSPEKKEGGKFQLHYNDSGHFGSTILASGGKMKHVFLTYDQPNYLFSADPLLYEDTELWSSKVIKKSTPITEMPPLDQIKYFNSIREKIAEEKSNVEKMLSK